MPNEFIFLNGAMVLNQEASIKPNDRGFLLGDGIFETIRAQNGMPFFFEKHWERFSKSAEALHIPLTISKDDLLEAIKNLLSANGLDTGHASLRVTLTGGPAPRGLLVKTAMTPTLMIAAFPLVPHDNSPTKVCVSPFPKNERSPIIQYKSTNYLENIFAKRDADAKGYEDALLLNTVGKITELTIANVFFIKGDTVFTPPVEDGLLPGVVRETVIEICNEKSIPIRVQSLTLGDLRQMDGMFLTNALMHLKPVSEVQGYFVSKNAVEVKLYNSLVDGFSQAALDSIQTSKNTLQK